MGTDINIKKKLAILNEGATITTDALSIDFVGSGVNAASVDGNTTVTISGGNGNTTYYFNYSVPIGSYSEFSSVPTSAAEQVIPWAVDPGDTEVAFVFETPLGVPNTTQIPAGLWQFFLHFNSLALTSNWVITPQVFKVDLSNVETLLFTSDPIIVTNMPPFTTMYVSDGVFPATTLLTTDRLLVKISLENTGLSTQSLNFVTEGSQHYSVAFTTLNQVVPTGAVTSVTGTAPIVSSGGTTPAISISQSSALTDGYLSSSDWSAFNAKQNAITLTTTGTSGAATLVGSTLNIPNYATSSSGIVGIANSSGVYTYYATLSLAMTAAVSGQTVEMFADITETSSVTITLKNGVNINGNGHTYTLSVNDGTNALTFALSGTVELYNLKVVRTGRTVGTSTGNVLSFQDGNAKIKCFNASFLNDFGYCCVGMGIIYNAHGIGYLDGMYDGLGNVRVYDSYFESTGTGIAINTPVGFLYNSTGKAVSGNGISCNGEVYECTGISSSGTGISAQRMTNCTGLSTSGTALSGEGRSCVGISTSGIGGSGTFYNSTLISSSNYGATATLYNSYTQSSSSVATNSSSIYNSTVRCLWNNVGGHCTSSNALGAREILNSFLEVTNASAYCITGYAGSTWKYASNIYKGATTPVNTTNITQGLINTQDNQGNILLW